MGKGRSSKLASITKVALQRLERLRYRPLVPVQKDASDLGDSSWPDFCLSLDGFYGLDLPKIWQKPWFFRGFDQRALSDSYRGNSRISGH